MVTRSDLQLCNDRGISVNYGSNSHLLHVTSYNKASPLTLYSSTCSKKMIGLSERMADFSSPLAFFTVDTATS
jgi:hypothetical protein